jgi:D-tyrosyl-tRNA(Tyr) deacylase
MTNGAEIPLRTRAVAREFGLRAVVQRVSQASVEVAGEVVGEIQAGLLVLVGVYRDDEDKDLDWLARKLTGLRIFPDEEGKMNRSVKDIGGQALMVSQFTICADVGKGTRPSFGKAMAPDEAQVWFGRLVERVSEDVPVQTGAFGEHMKIDLTNDGPVTIWLDSQRRG